ncbi:hypothetical protein [Actinacidiphila paucisporea]|uniref:DUF4034 domain-containing protein n=1 Tax=Actinacidiphila paucisporea TaxID=310782 RepID=A0A1M7I0M3_9ACTN|nr:hypothetical protein [Actinacidiphila paucisporea]SHM33937.1 hypothetical protein SAMN05216499_11098 [Actinacidiphila paucisporea]
MNIVVDIAGACLLVYAAVTIPRNIRKGRAARARAKAALPIKIDAAAYGLVPAAQVDAGRPAPDPQADAAVAAARAGDWRHPAAYLADAGYDWDLRWYRTRHLADATEDDDGWLTAWRTESPGDPGAALVHAAALVSLAGRVRGTQSGSRTTAEQFAGFHRLLAEALPACQEAAYLSPYDPNPYVAQISIAYGLGWSHEDFRQLWAQITARDPHHFAAHSAALQFWCEKWCGSRELMFDFAEQAAASAPRGSLLPFIRIYAVLEQESRDPDYSIYQEPYVTAAVDATLDAVDLAPAGHHRLPAVRHLLANALFRTRRYAEAVEQFRAIGGYAGAVPWTYSRDPLKEFVHARTNTFIEWEKAGRPTAPPRATV